MGHDPLTLFKPVFKTVYMRFHNVKGRLLDDLVALICQGRWEHRLWIVTSLLFLITTFTIANQIHVTSTFNTCWDYCHCDCCCDDLHLSSLSRLNINSC